MARNDTTDRQALWQPGGAEEDSHFHEGDRHKIRYTLLSRKEKFLQGVLKHTLYKM